MKFTLSWLKQHLETEASLDEITGRLTMHGLELESVEDRSKELAPFTVAYVKEQQAVPTAVLLDPSGDVGHLYEARTTPHMFVIDAQGVIVYDGALDDKPTRDAADIATATNYVSAALTEAMAGNPVSVPTSRPYG